MLKDYRQRSSNSNPPSQKPGSSPLPSLDASLLRKLRLLTAVELASRSREVSYAVLQKELEISDLRELEDLLVELNYQGLVVGRLDSRAQVLEVEDHAGRDVRPEQLPALIERLAQWGQSCAKISASLKEEMKRSDEAHGSAVTLARKRVETQDSQLAQLLETVEQTAAAGVNVSGAAGAAMQGVTRRESREYDGDASKMDSMRTRMKHSGDRHNRAYR